MLLSKICFILLKWAAIVSETGKKAGVKESKQLFLFSQCLENAHSYVQTESGDHIFSPILFIVNFQGSHFELAECIIVSH